MHRHGGLRLMLGGGLLALLCACSRGNGAQEQALKLRTAYLSMSEYQAEVHITADYGDRIYAYTADAKGTQISGTLAVTAPEEIAGATVRWQEGDTGLEYDGISVETGELSPDGLSPVDGLPLILTCIRRGDLTDCWEEDSGDARTLVVTYDAPESARPGLSQVQIRAEEPGYALRQAEVLWDGSAVLTVAFSSFTYD